MLRKIPPNARNKSINSAPLNVAIGMDGDAADINIDALVKPTFPIISSSWKMKKYNELPVRKPVGQ